MRQILKIGIICYPSIGGSGVVATNLGLELAKLGHQAHFISYDAPIRLVKSPNIHFHKVKINEYALFKYPDYTLPLAVKIGEVFEKFGLDIIHVHYAVPHATAAILACQMLKKCGHKRRAPKIITTLHGTDITLLAEDPNLFEIIKYSIEASDGVTAVSQSLKKDTLKILKTKKPIRVIYNFYSPARITHSREWVRRSLGIKNDDFLAIHLSNLRSVKRIPDLLKTASLISAKGARLPVRQGSASGGHKFKLLILAGGDFKPYLPLVKKLKIQNQIIIKQNPKNLENYLNASDLGLYTSEKESFGLGILETMAFKKPVVATRVGGIPEVIGNTGLLAPVGDVHALAANVKKMMNNGVLRERMGLLAQKRAQAKFSTQKIVGEYLSYYRQIVLG